MEGYGQGDFATDRFNGGAMTAGAMLSKPVTDPIPLVAAELRNLERSVKRLDQVLGQLAGRIDPVCRVEPPPVLGVNGVEAARARANSGLGSQVAGYADQIDGLAMRVDSLLRRCEL